MKVKQFKGKTDSITFVLRTARNSDSSEDYFIQLLQKDGHENIQYPSGWFGMLWEHSELQRAIGTQFARQQGTGGFVSFGNIWMITDRDGRVKTLFSIKVNVAFIAIVVVVHQLPYCYSGREQWFRNRREMTAGEGSDYYSGRAWYEGLEERKPPLMCRAIKQKRLLHSGQRHE